jgi:Flp pilus assembly protein TadD
MASPELPHPDVHHLRAAMGWLELGNACEAGEEIARISAAHLEQPDVLKVRWQICAAGQSWDAALPIAQRMVETSPEEAQSWIQRSYTLRRAREGGLEFAWEALLPAANLFPSEPIVAFNLACYAAQFGKPEEAINWLRKALAVSDNRGVIKNMALADKDLQPVWDRIRQL